MSFYPQVTAKWVARAKAQGLKPDSKRYADAQLEFFIGATAGAQAATGEVHHSMALVALSIGQDSRDLWPAYTEHIKCSVNDDGQWVLYADRFHTNESLAAYGSSKQTEYEQANGDWSK
jgi:hypothetical protein